MHLFWRKAHENSSGKYTVLIVYRYVLSGLALLYQGAKSEKIMEYWSEALNMLGKSK